MGNRLSIDKQIAAMPPLPTTVTRVLDVINDPESSANDLMKAILPDQAMCLAILKVANSVIYGRPRKVNSVETAIVVLGFNEVRNIVLGKAAVTTFQKVFSGQAEEFRKFWEHGFATGLGARVIGEHLGLSPGQFFIGGLLHDIGKLAMFLALGSNYDVSQWLTGITTLEKHRREMDSFSVTHDAIGARLLKLWQFPDSLVASLHSHHQPAIQKNLRGYPLIIQLADFLAHMTSKEASTPSGPGSLDLDSELQRWLPDFHTHWQSLGLPWEETSLDSWFAWLKVDLNHGSSILDILARQ